MLYNRAYGQYVLLFHADTVSFDYNTVGVAVSDSVTGPYEYIRVFHPDGLNSLDMGVFQVCFLQSFTPTLHPHKLISSAYCMSDLVLEGMIAE